MDGLATWDEVEGALSQHREVKATLDLLVEDIASTLGCATPEAGDFVIDTAAAILDFIDESDWSFELRLIEDVQQRIHDELVHTSSPECPIHGRHPMWMTDKAPWEWRCSGVTIPLGRIGAHSQGMSPEA